MQEGMGTHFTILAWKIAWTEDLGRLQSKGLKEMDQTEWLGTHALP